MDIINHPIVDAIFEGENPKSIFEIGCAGGRLFSGYFDKRTRLNSTTDTGYDHTRLIVGGIEIHPENIEVAREIYPEYAHNFIAQDASEPWPLADKSYDIVFSLGCLLLIPDPYPVIKEALRVGKKVILAEFQDDDADDFGVNRGPEPTEAHGQRIYRDYRKVFKKLGLTPTITKCNDKWIIRV